MSIISYFATWIWMLAFVSSQTLRRDVNEILSIFKTCYTDLIFSKNVSDIAPKNPIIISTPERRVSVTLWTIRKAKVFRTSITMTKGLGESTSSTTHCYPHVTWWKWNDTPPDQSQFQLRRSGTARCQYQNWDSFGNPESSQLASSHSISFQVRRNRTLRLHVLRKEFLYQPIVRNWFWPRG